MLAFPRGTIWPRFLFFRLLGTERGRERGEMISNRLMASSHHAEPKPFITLGLVPPSQGRGDTCVGHKGQSHLAVLWMLWHSHVSKHISHCIREKVSPPVGTTVKAAPVWHLPERTHRARRSLPPSPAQGRVLSSRRIRAPGRFPGLFYTQHWVQYAHSISSTRSCSELRPGRTKEERKLSLERRGGSEGMLLP